jgi:hypothetical protein
MYCTHVCPRGLTSPLSLSARLPKGSGASSEGNRPFLDVLDLDSKESTRIWRSSPPYYEYTSSILSDPSGSRPVSLNDLKMLASR